MKRLAIIVKNLARMLLLLVAVSIAAFALVSLSPVDPLAQNVGQTALGSLSEQQIEKLERYWGVDEPPVSRYLAWAGDFVRGDMGVSLAYRRGVAEVLGEKLLSSLWLMLFAWVVSGVLGFALGAVAGVKRGRPADKLIKTFALVTASTPAFWLALLTLLVFAVWLGWFPIGLAVPIGMESAAVSLADRLRHAVLPACVLSIVSMSGVILHTREKMIDCMESDYVLFALARGETRRSIALRHGVRNVLLPAVTLQFAAISEIFGGSVLVEQVFSYPGLGKAAVAAGLGGDIPLLMGITVISAAIVFAGNLAANLLYGVIDPRMKARGRGA
jgi:peptide/nickel transport system permease protein